MIDSYVQMHSKHQGESSVLTVGSSSDQTEVASTLRPASATFDAVEVLFLLILIERIENDVISMSRR